MARFLWQLLSKSSELTKLRFPTFNQVEELFGRMNSSKAAPSIVELNSVLHNAVSKAPLLEVANGRAPYMKAKEELGKEFGSAFALYEAKINRMINSVVAMESKGANLLDEIAAWEFKDCSWVKNPKDKPDANTVSAAKGIEAAVQGFENMQQISAELKAKGSTSLPLSKGRLNLSMQHFLMVSTGEPWTVPGSCLQTPW